MNNFSRGGAAAAALILTLNGCGGAFAPQDNTVALKPLDPKVKAELDASCTFYNNVLTFVDQQHFNGPLSVSQQEVAAGAMQELLKSSYRKIGYNTVTNKMDESIVAFKNPGEKDASKKEIATLKTNAGTMTYTAPPATLQKYADHCGYLADTAITLAKTTSQPLKTMFEYAVNGALHASRDPHTTFLDAANYKELMTSSKGEFGGLGLSFSVKDGIMEAMKVFRDTPAAKAGIIKGDKITKANGESIFGKTAQEVAELLRGKPGTDITLTIERDGQAPREATLTRAIIVPPAVDGKLVGEKKNAAYLKINDGYTKKTIHALSKKMFDLAAEAFKNKVGIKTVIVDVRNNPGGDLDAAKAVSDLFVEGAKRGQIQMGPRTALVALGKTAKDDVTYAETVIENNVSDYFPGASVKVLQNGDSASASEITAGALQDAGHEVVGTKSFGKGSAQSIFPLNENGTMARYYKGATLGIKITTDAFFPGKGLSNQGSGIIPNTEVKYGDVRDKVAAEGLREEQLGRALISTEQTRAGQTPQNVCSLKAEFSGELSAQQVKSLPDYLVTDYMLVPDEEKGDFKEVKVFDADLACALKDTKYTTTKPFMPN